jgi:N6-adenosine-specific RNA methylase IME4
MNMKIDKEFERLIPPLTDEEFNLLTINCVFHGIHDSIKTWNNIIIDGHNRYKISKVHNLKFKIEEIKFDDREKVVEWILNNQLGRRNLNPDQMSIIRGRLYNLNKISHGGDRKSKGQNDTLKNTAQDMADKYKVSERTIKRDGQFVEDHPEEAEKILNGEITKRELNEQKKAEKKQEIRQREVTSESKSIDIYNTDKKYNIIYADPAWQYWETGNKNQSNHYKTMTLDEICSLPVKNIADDNCILFLWVTFPILKDSFKVIESWGFKYCTCGFNWIKRNKKSDSYFFGCGSWTRANSELCLISTKGKVERLDNTISQIIDSKIEEHSKKPNIIYNLIEKLVGKMPRIELFARNTQNGWDCWGNEL